MGNVKVYGVLELVVVGLFFLSMWLAVASSEFEDAYTVNGVDLLPHIQALYPYGDAMVEGDLDSNYWGLPSVQEQTGRMAAIHFPDELIVFAYGVWWIWLEEEWKIMACDARGRELYVGCDIPELLEHRDVVMERYWEEQYGK